MKLEMKKLITLTFLLFVSFGFSQSKYTADKYFKEFAYVKSAELYAEIYKKGDSTKLVIERLADSYYFNLNTSESEIWYKKLFNLYESEGLPSKYYFRYAQSLKSNGKYKESDQWLLKLEKLSENDSRVKGLKNLSNYYNDFTNKKKEFINIFNVSTNTKYSDYGVFILGDRVLFSSTRPDLSLKKNRLYKWNKQPFLNIYETRHVETNNDTNDKVMNIVGGQKIKHVNSRYHEASAVVTKDGKTMYFTRDNFDGKTLKGNKKRVSHLKIYKAELIDNNWTNIIELPFNSDEYSTGQPALNMYENELYFVSDMPGGFGGTDIYKVEILENNLFGKPVNLGATINTEGKEMFPFISSDKTLYFSSNGHIGLGALDIFQSNINGNSYSKPVNLGSPINGKKDDFAFVINDENSRGFISSNRAGGKGDDDIYSFEVYKCQEFLSGTVFNIKTKEIIPLALVQLLNSEGIVIQSTTADEMGKYTFGIVACEKNYVVVATKPDHKSGINNFTTKNINKYMNVQDLFLTPLIIETQIVVNPIRFDFDKSNIREDAEYELEKVVSVMKAHPDVIIKIESHTDSRGNDDYNRALSDRRAKSTRDYILSRGIAPNRIVSAIGYGEDQLLNDCDDDNADKCSKEEHQLNRRSYFYIVSGKYVKSVNK